MAPTVDLLKVEHLSCFAKNAARYGGTLSCILHNHSDLRSRTQTFDSDLFYHLDGAVQTLQQLADLFVTDHDVNLAEPSKQQHTLTVLTLGGMQYADAVVMNICSAFLLVGSLLTGHSEKSGRQNISAMKVEEFCLAIRSTQFEEMGDFTKLNKADPHSNLEYICWRKMQNALKCPMKHLSRLQLRLLLFIQVVKVQSMCARP